MAHATTALSGVFGSTVYERLAVGGGMANKTKSFGAAHAQARENRSTGFGLFG